MHQVMHAQSLQEIPTRQHPLAALDEIIESNGLEETYAEGGMGGVTELEMFLQTFPRVSRTGSASQSREQLTYFFAI